MLANQRTMPSKIVLAEGYLFAFDHTDAMDIDSFDSVLTRYKTDVNIILQSIWWVVNHWCTIIFKLRIGKRSVIILLKQ